MSAPPKESFALRIFGLLAEAFGWGVFGGIVLAVTAVAANVIAERLYALNPSHSISGLIYGLLALIAGFFVSAGMRLARPGWTAGQMCIGIAALALLCGAGILQLGRVDASYEHVTRRECPSCAVRAHGLGDPNTNRGTQHPESMNDRSLAAIPNAGFETSTGFSSWNQTAWLRQGDALRRAV